MIRPVTLGSPLAQYPLVTFMARPLFFYKMAESWSSGVGSDYVHVLSQVDIYDPDTGIWSQAAPLHQGRLAHTATVLPDGRVVVVGEFKRWEDDWQSADDFLNSVEIYNPCTGQWEEGPARAGQPWL